MTRPDDHRSVLDDESELPIEELALRQGVRPIESILELSQPDLWKSDEELEEFLVDLYASRRAGLT